MNGTAAGELSPLNLVIIVRLFIKTLNVIIFQLIINDKLNVSLAAILTIAFVYIYMYVCMYIYI